MDVVQAISLIVVLLFALYGCAQGFVKICERLLRPRDMRLRLLLPLCGHVENVEQQIRAAQELAVRLRLPLLVVNTGADDEAQRIAQLLLRDGVGQLIEGDEMEELQ